MGVAPGLVERGFVVRKVNSSMERLTEVALPIGNTFKKCQLCGYESDDICEFWLWNECDEQDQEELYNILVTCRKDECLKQIDEHERLYAQLDWSSGYPGHLSLLCGECPHRDGFKCSHPSLRANGGEGLTLMVANDAISRAIVCTHSDESESGLQCHMAPPRYVKCSGLPEGHPRHCDQEP